MLIRKPSKAFKTIVQILEACHTHPDRNQLVRLYITRAGQSIQDRIAIEGIATDQHLFYELNYTAILNNLRTAGKQLYASEDEPGIYFLRSTPNGWDETPLEFAEIVTKKFAGLPELPLTRKKSVPVAVVLPTAKESMHRSAKQTTGKVKASPKAKMPDQPSLGLQHEITFTHLDHHVFTQALVNKRDVLTYYHLVAPHLLPWLKDRQLYTQSQSQTPTSPKALTLAHWETSSAEPLPTWVAQRASAKAPHLSCTHHDQLLFWVEHGCLAFHAALARLGSPIQPDYLLLFVSSSQATHTISVVQTLKEIMDGLHLPSFLQTDGSSGFYVYLPLDGKSDYDTVAAAARYLCSLARLKRPDLITLHETDETTYGKVSLQTVATPESYRLAPYSLVPGPLPVVAAPLQWADLHPEFDPEELTISAVLKRLKSSGDPFAAFLRKKVNATTLLALLEERYAFLI